MTKKTKGTHLKKPPGSISYPSEEGQVHLVPESMMCGVCSSCNSPPFFVSTRMGVMCCPHCMADASKILWAWGKQRQIFVPETDFKLLQPESAVGVRADSGDTEED